MIRALRRWTPLLAVALLLAAAWAAAVLSSPELNNLPVPPLSTTLPTAVPTGADEPEESPAAEDQTEVQMPDETSGLISIVVLAVAVIVGGVVTWILVRKRVFHSRGGQLVVQRPVVAKRRSRPQDVVDAIDAGLNELSDLAADPRGAVIACWVRLERAAALAGTPRLAADSPTDLVTRLLVSHRVNPRVLEGLAIVYREARFATHQIDEEQRSAALAALGQIRAELGQRPDPDDPAGRGWGEPADAGARYATAGPGGGTR